MFLNLLKIINRFIKTSNILSFVMLLVLCLFASYPHAKEIFAKYSISYYQYQPKNPVVSEVDTSQMPPGRAVPILMYHGITEITDKENTDQVHFIAQMEMLKKNGYQTISLAEMDQFFQGKFTLPPKPIVITFDDGRKDSYYPTDDIFKKFGFKATLFEVTGKPNKQDKFYLSWDELKELQNTFRWEIEAHGRNSHDKIQIAENGGVGRFLTSRMYIDGKGLETVEEYEQRVEQDYVDGINDLKDRLGIEAKYYAIPLNEYRIPEVTNYPESVNFNRNVNEKYFRMAFIETDSRLDPRGLKPPVYNFSFDDPYQMKRIEVKNMEADELKNILEKSFPTAIDYNAGNFDIENFKKRANVMYGNIFFDQAGLHLKSTSELESAKVFFGDMYWNNYTIEAQVQKISGRSIALVAYATDNQNNITFGITDNGLFLREMTGNQEFDIAPYVPLDTASNLPHNLKLTLNNGIATAYIDERLVYDKVNIKLDHGFAGFKIWDDLKNGEGILQTIKVKSIN